MLAGVRIVWSVYGWVKLMECLLVSEVDGVSSSVRVSEVLVGVLSVLSVCYCDECLECLLVLEASGVSSGVRNVWSVCCWKQSLECLRV